MQPDVMQKAATALMKGGVFQPPRVSAKTIAEQVAERINSKLNYIPQVFYVQHWYFKFLKSFIRHLVVVHKLNVEPVFL